MAWQCAVCYDGKNVDVVCHHCGKPLCDNEETCRAFIVDEDFAGEGVQAYHCPSCVREHHPRATTRLRRAAA